MHHHRIVASLLGMAALTGCASLKHNDVLVFATQTKVALDVSASPINGGTPSFTFGYKREEGVWMPLVVNGRDSVVLASSVRCTADGRNCFTVPAEALEAFNICARQQTADKCLAALQGKVKYIGTADGREDTYSVFASFGGEFSGSGGGKAALAQFFATGIAAQNLAKNAGIERSLVVQGANDERVAAAEEQARMATQIALRSQGAEAIRPVAAANLSIIDKTMICWNRNRTDYATAVHAKLDSSDLPLAKMFDGTGENAEAELRGALEQSPGSLAAIGEVTTAKCP
jgi:hypothetical protein